MRSAATLSVGRIGSSEGGVAHKQISHGRIAAGEDAAKRVLLADLHVALGTVRQPDDGIDLAPTAMGGLTFGAEISVPGLLTVSNGQPVQFPQGPVRSPLSTTFMPIDVVPFVDGYDAAAMIQLLKEFLEQPATIFM